MLTKIVLCLGLACYSSAQFDIRCTLKGPAATFYKIDTNGKTVINDGSTLDSTKTTFFIIHGWNGTSSSGDYEEIGRELSVTGNAILVDYTDLALNFYGTCAYYIVDTLGDFVANFIKTQTDAGYMNPSRIHIIGHSTGGQTAGKVGREVQKLTGTKIKRISALDPAGPFFTLIIVRIPFISLGPSDAELVDVLHTSVFFGELARMGHVDFYVQSFLGIPDFQRACGLTAPIFCSHQMSKKIFLEAINSCGFVGTRGLSKEQKMIYGMHMPLDASGRYSFSINGKSTYAQGDSQCP